MVGLSTMTSAVRDEILQIMNEKSKVEKEIKELFEVLEHNNIGMTEPLVDYDGFPRNDIDVFQVRHARHQIICLQNDHKLLMARIEAGLHKLHSIERGSGQESTDDPLLRSLEPFAQITLVSPKSPAQICGLEVNDKILQFGSVSLSNFKNMTDIAVVVNHSEGSQIKVIVKRGNRNSPITLELIPQKWSGQGLLGCKIDPLDSVER